MSGGGNRNFWERSVASLRLLSFKGLLSCLTIIIGSNEAIQLHYGRTSLRVRNISSEMSY